ncbi:S1C family serine protease [Cryptosporangium sp. NPDC051539]|uniref:S1C family serine protease n=1 Tax=Cryptosporangium sp. NPDC051539 TaxID=3363962 RepID=UPI00379C794C
MVRCRYATVLLTLAVLAGCSGSGGSVSTAASTGAGAPDPSDLADVVENVAPSLVTVTAHGSPTSHGSGVVYRDDVVVTNEHVVGTAKTVTLTLADGATVAGSVVGTDAVADLAVIKAARTNLPAVPIRTELARAGESTLAITGTGVARGLVSAVGSPEEIRTDIPAEGSGLFDTQGRLIGLGTRDNAAVPSAVIAYTADRLLAGRPPRHPDLGVSLAELTSAIRNALGVDAEKGAIVVAAGRASPATKAGIRPGDVVTRVGTTPIATLDDVGTALRGLTTADTDLVVQRGGNAILLRVPVQQM